MKESHQIIIGQLSDQSGDCEFSVNLYRYPDGIKPKAQVVLDIGSRDCRSTMCYYLTPDKLREVSVILSGAACQIEDELRQQNQQAERRAA